MNIHLLKEKKIHIFVKLLNQDEKRYVFFEDAII
jgi:hypothetical protein